MAKDTHDLGAAAYNQPGTFRTCNHDVAKRCGWLAAAVFDHLQSLEVRYAADRVERDGRLWFYRPVSEVAAHVHAKRDAFDGAVARLEEHGFLHRLKMKGKAKAPCMHWSVDWSAFAPSAENPQTVDGGKCGKPANVNAGNPQTVGGYTSTKETEPKKHHPQPSPKGSQGALALGSGDTPKVPADAQAIWSHYQEVMGKPKAKITAKFGNTRLSRLAGIKAWLRQETDEGPNTVEKAKQLIDGLSRSEHHRQQGYDCISYALRPNNEKRFLAHLTASQGHGSKDTIDTDAWLKGLGVK